MTNFGIWVTRKASACGRFSTVDCWATNDKGKKFTFNTKDTAEELACRFNRDWSHLNQCRWEARKNPD